MGIGRLSADADNRPIICFSKKNNKNALTAVHIDDNEVTNDSVISHLSSSTFNRTK